LSHSSQSDLSVPDQLRVGGQLPEGDGPGPVPVLVSFAPSRGDLNIFDRCYRVRVRELEAIGRRPDGRDVEPEIHSCHGAAVVHNEVVLEGAVLDSSVLVYALSCCWYSCVQLSRADLGVTSGTSVNHPYWSMSASRARRFPQRRDVLAAMETAGVAPLGRSEAGPGPVD
jgi:hypothetical protein